MNKFMHLEKSIFVSGTLAHFTTKLIRMNRLTWVNTEFSRETILVNFIPEHSSAICSIFLIMTLGVNATASIEAYETQDGYITVDFIDGSNPFHPSTDCIPYGEKLPEIINYIIDEAGVEVVTNVTNTTMKQYNGHFKYPHPEQRKRIVEDYRRTRNKGEITNKNSWAQTNYGISGKTLLAYEREFPEEI